jgi:lambda family phage portal protein
MAMLGGKALPKLQHGPQHGSVPSIGRSRVESRYMNDTSANWFGSWQTTLRDSQDDVQQAWTMAAARSIDSIHNSGWLSGAVDQASADTIGTGLRLNATPDAEALGWSPEYTRKFCRSVEKRWRTWSQNPLECDARGKLTVAQMTDAAIRQFFPYGEATALLPSIRRRESATTTKVLMLPPHRLSTENRPFEGLHQGVWLDANGMPVAYRFRRRSPDGTETLVDFTARSRTGRPQVIHVFDGTPDQVRGISPLTPVLLRTRQYDQLADATLTTALLQTIIAATIKTTEVGDGAFDGLQPSSTDADGNVTPGSMGDVMDAYMEGKVAWWKNKSIDLGAKGRVAQLFPGEEFQLHSAATPHDNYLPYSKSLLREIARGIGITYEANTGDYEGATYSSVRMSTSVMWPITLRRRHRIAVPFLNPIFAAWLEEEIESGRQKFRGGIEHFRANRAAATSAEWHGPAKPTADDHKAAKAATERLANNTSTLTYEMGEIGMDPETVFEQRAQERDMALSYGLPDPYAPPPVPGAPAPAPAPDPELEDA